MAFTQAAPDHYFIVTSVINMLSILLHSVIYFKPCLYCSGGSAANNTAYLESAECVEISQKFQYIREVLAHAFRSISIEYWANIWKQWGGIFHHHIQGQ
jgi:hypothetical protein